MGLCKWGRNLQWRRDTEYFLDILTRRFFFFFLPIMELLSSIFSKIIIKLLNFFCCSQFWLSFLLRRKWNITKIKEENGKFKMCNVFNMRNLLTIWLKLLTLFLARMSSTNLVNLIATLKVKEILFNKI